MWNTVLNIGIFWIWVASRATMTTVAIICCLGGLRGNALNTLISEDQTWNTIFGGYPDETMSARVHRMHRTSTKWYVAKLIINGIFFWQPDHCAAAYESEATRRHLPTQYKEM